MAWGTYLLRSSFVSVFIRLRVKARHHDYPLFINGDKKLEEKEYEGISKIHVQPNPFYTTLVVRIFIFVFHPKIQLSVY
jgi:hypothetical protein